MIDITLHCAVIEWPDGEAEEPTLIVTLSPTQTTLDVAVALLDWMKGSVEGYVASHDQLGQYVDTDLWRLLAGKDALTEGDLGYATLFLSEFHEATTAPWVSEYEKEITA